MIYADLMKIAKRAAADQANAIQADAAEKLKQAQADAFQIARAAADYKRAQAYAGVFEIVSKFDDEWKDRGSGALLSATFYKPLVSDGYLTLGHFAWPSYGAVRGNMLALKADGPVPWKYPVDYKKVWDDSGSGANWDGSFWAAIAPPGYAAVGMLAQRGYKKPKRTEIVCLREDFVERYDPDVMIWNDRGSGADDDVSVWLIGRLGTFYAHRKYKDPGESAATLADHALFPVQGKEPGEALRNTITWAKDFKTLGDLSEHQSVVTPVTEKNYVPLCDAIVNFKDSTRPALPLLWLDGILPWQYPTDYQAQTRRRLDRVGTAATEGLRESGGVAAARNRPTGSQRSRVRSGRISATESTHPGRGYDRCVSTATGPGLRRIRRAE